MCNLIIVLYLYLCFLSQHMLIMGQPIYKNTDNNLISLMIKDYVLPLSLKNDLKNDIKDDIKDHIYSFNPKFKPTNNNWFQILNNYFTKLDTKIQTEIMSLNRAIINATDQLLNMCDKMVEKTTSVLPMSYSYKFATDYEIYTQSDSISEDFDSVLDSDTKASNFFNLFSAKNQNKEKDKKDFITHTIATDNSLNNKALKTQLVDDMVAYNAYRTTINSRNLFLNSLCSHTFGSPYTLYYNFVNNTLNFAANIAVIDYYILVLQNIIDNSHIRGLNYAFKAYKKLRDKNNNNNKAHYSGLYYDIELDIDPKKTESLVEKAKYILPFLQKFEKQLSTYLYDISKRSLTFDEYFVNLKLFWENIGQEAHIGSQMYPFKYKTEMLEAKEKMEKEQLEKERLIKIQLEAEMEADKKAEMEALRIITEFRNKKLIDDAINYVREQEIIQKDRKTNYSIIEWTQFNRKIKQHVFGFTSTLVSGINGAVKAPKDFVIDFAIETVLDLGKIAVLALVLVYFVLYSLKKLKSFVFYNKNDNENDNKNDK